MNQVVILVLSGLIFIVDASQAPCKSPPVSGSPTGWINMDQLCLDMMKRQVQTELTAALTYLSMGAHFSRDSVNRPGFANMFFKSASEEREHAMAIINYVNMRGGFSSKEQYLSKLIEEPRPLDVKLDSGLKALKAALELEIHVTKNITEIIKVCENPPNDYHLVDYLTEVFLDEQLKGQRELAGRITTLGKMVNGKGILGEFLYDKKLLEEFIV